MELHATYRGDRFLAMVGIGYGVAAGIAGALFMLSSGRVNVATLVLWGSGGFFALIGLYLLIKTLQPTRLAFDDHGLVVRSEGHVFEGPWDQIEAIAISTIPKQNEDDKDRHNLVLWVPPHVKMRHKPTYPIWSEKKGHVLIELSNVKETPEEVAAILSRYARDKFHTPR
jgi:hypothetical protein